MAWHVLRWEVAAEGQCWLSGGPQLVLGSVATYCPTYIPFGKKSSDRYILFCK